MSKESFIEKLTKITPQELNKIIEEKGKKPRLRDLFVESKKEK